MATVEPHPLGRLIRAVMESTEPPLGWADLSRRTGGELIPQHIHRLATRPMKELPTPDTLGKLARALQPDVPLDSPLSILPTVVRAAVESLGLPVSSEPVENVGEIADRLRRMIAKSYEISPELRGRWLTLATVIEQMQHEADAQNKPDPTNGTTKSVQSG